MDPQLLARLQQMMGGGAAPPPMAGGGGMPMPFQPPANAGPMPAPLGGMNMPMGAPSGGWPLGLAQQSGGRPPPAPPPGGRPPPGPGGDRPRQPPPDGRPPAPKPTPKPTPKPAAPKPVARPGDKDFDMGKYLQSFVGRGITEGDYTSAMHYGGDVMMRMYDIAKRLPGQPQAAAPTPKPTPKPDGRPPGPGTPPPNPTQSGFPAQLEGVNPIISPMFRHLFSNADVAKYGIKQPNYISNAYFNDKGLNWQTGVQKKWWEPNNPVVWNKD